MSEFTLMPAIGISATGLDAENRRMEVIANNMANAQSTRGQDGKVFQRKEVIFAARLSDAIGGGMENKLQGVELRKIVADERPPKLIYRPGHPEADENGYVTMPNVNPIEEMVDMMSASRSYEANLAAVRMSKNMASQALDILK